MVSMASVVKKRADSVKVIANLRMVVVAGQVVPSPKIASVLGPKGIQIPKFCEEVNKCTKQPGLPFSIGDSVTVVITVYSDKSYDFSIRDASVAFLLLKFTGLKAGCGTTGRANVGSISVEDVKKIAIRKMPDMNAFSIEGAMRTVMGVARSMGIKVIGV